MPHSANYKVMKNWTSGVAREPPTPPPLCFSPTGSQGPEGGWFTSLEAFEQGSKLVRPQKNVSEREKEGERQCGRETASRSHDAYYYRSLDL